MHQQAIFSSQEVTQINIAAVSGDMGILANHVPAIEPLKPGVIEVFESAGQSKKWFGGWLGIRGYIQAWQANTVVVPL